MKIKKTFQPIIEALESVAPDTPVADVLPAIIELASAKTGGGGKATSFHRDENGNVVAIKCYYFKQWMNPQEVEFGVKKSSPTGLNIMCKEGASHWSKQQARFKKAKEQLLADVAAGEVDVTAIPGILAELEEQSKEIAASELPMFNTLEECLQAYS